jgi:hypothetical protein
VNRDWFPVLCLTLFVIVLAPVALARAYLRG